MLTTVPVRVEQKAAAAFVGQRHQAVVTACPLRTEARLDILRAGANAIGAAVTAASIFRVSEPSVSGPNGPGCSFVSQTVEHAFFRAPAVASLGTVKAGEHRRGYHACTVPSTPQTLDRAQEYGALSPGNVGWLRQITLFTVLAHAFGESFANMLDRDGSETVCRLHNGGRSDRRDFNELAKCVGPPLAFPGTVLVEAGCT